MRFWGRFLLTCGVLGGLPALLAGIDINYQLSQPQILIEDGHIYIVPAQGKNLVLSSNGEGKILFDSVEMRSLVSSIQNSSRDLNNFKQIFGNPSNRSSGMSQRISSLEHAIDRLSMVDSLDTRLTTVEMQLLVNLSSSQDTDSSVPASRRQNINNRLRRLTRRVQTIETRLQNLGVSTGTNPCSSNPCSNGGSCIPTAYGPFCWCREGWEGPTCTDDVNECQNFAGTDLGCQNNAVCVNRPGGYDCQCQAGWIGIHCTRRQGDCSSGPAWELCGHGVCINQQSGSRPFTCICEQGWKTDGTSPACTVDVNECDTGTALCSSNPPVSCINTPGSYICGPCPSGYTGNGHRCMDINECLVGNGGCSMNPMVHCINTPGSRTCGECPAGYVGNGMSCQYVGMCAVNNGGCHPMARCVENPMIGQSFVQCLCPAGYTGTGMGLHGCFPYGGSGTGPVPLPRPEQSNPCARNPCSNGGICQAFGNAFSCVCINGFTGTTCNVRLSPCSSQPCQNQGVCVDSSEMPRGFICQCTSDYTGMFCEQQVQSCGGELYAPNGTMRFPHDSSQDLYRDNMNCNWVLRTPEVGKILTLNFTRFHLEGYGGSCPHDSLTIRDGLGPMATPIGIYCGDLLPNGGQIVSTHDVLTLEFKSDHSIVGLGFEFEWNSTEPLCGGYVTNQTHGSINSPGYPGNYPHNRDCEWLIEVTPGKRIQLVFATFRIEQHPNCSFDYFMVKDGIDENSPVLAQYCSTTLPPPLVSSGPYLTIKFHTDHSASDSGFHITFAEVPGVPGCGGVLTTPVGIFASPQHPEPYIHGLECDWVIRLSSQDERISLHFNTFELEGGRNCMFDYVEVRDGPSPTNDLVGRFCGGNVPPDFTSSGNQLFVRFKSDESVAYGGFSAKYEAACGGVFSAPEGILRTPFYPNNYPKSRECVYLIEAPAGKGILLDFLDFDVESGLTIEDSRCVFDYVEIRDGDTENSTLIGHYCGPPDSAPERVVSTHNYIWIKFKTDSSIQNRGFLANYSTYDTGCGGILRASHGVISSPGHPEVYPNGVSCTWVLRGAPGQAVRLSWVSFSLEGGSCFYDYVQIFDNSTLFRNGSSMGRYCGQHLPPVLTSSDNTMTVRFQSDHSVASDGFMANYVLLNTSTVCGGEYYSEYGVIRSPRYPQAYPNRKSCIWKIQVPTGKQIRLNITDFDVENGSNGRCNYDYLEVRNGGYPTSPLIGQFCGNMPPPAIIPSHTNSLYLKFSSDISHGGRGFLITWDGTTTGCGGSLSSPSGSIMSPNYPMSYGTRTECIWTIAANQGSMIQLIFSDLDIQHSSDSCWSEFVEIRDGRDGNAPRLGKFCQPDSVLSVNTTGSQAWIKFKSGYSGSGRGFQLNYRTSCNRVIENSFQGVIESPNFPNPYPHNRNCTWEIRAPRGNKLNVSFSHFDVEDANTCRYDFVELKEWSSFDRTPSPSSIGKFCGSRRPPLVTSTKETVAINFVSDYSHALNGFRLEWKVHGCGGRLVGPYHSLKTPNYPQKYSENTICIWHITTELGTKVRLDIFELDIEHESDCIYDGLVVYGGSDASSPELTKLCHSLTSPTVITSHGNNMYIKFYSDGSIPAKGFFGSARAIPGGCGGRVKAPHGTIYSPNYPGEYDHNDDCGWLIEVDRNHVVELQFLDFNVERHINCSYDHVAVYDGGSRYDPQLLMHCGNGLPSYNPIRSTGNKMFVRLKTDGSSSSRGFKANFTQGCGARINYMSRWSRDLTSPHWPMMMASVTNCTWYLTAPDPEDRVTLTFTNLDIPSREPGCEDSQVEVLDGTDEDAASLGKFCGYNVPPSLTSSGNGMIVKLLARNRGHGFRAVFDFARSACGFTNILTAENGSFTSPNYPNGYPPNTECVWIIKAPAGNNVSIAFRQFNLEESEYCNTDFVEVHETSPEGRLLGHFCGNQIPSNLTGANALWILFRTDAEGQAPGFWADYALNHGNELYGPSGVIESPGYPKQNTLTGQYSWRITVNESRAVQIQFTEVDIMLYEVQSCGVIDINRIQIFDGFDTEAPSLLDFCGGDSIDPITSTGNVVFIVFSKPLWHGKFRLTWNEVQSASTIDQFRANVTGCGGNVSIIEGNTTMLLSPNYPFNYPDHARCEWYINSPPHTRIQIHIEDFDMESDLACLYDKLEVYDGALGQPNYVLNKTVCHRSQINGTLISSGRFLKLMMITDYSESRPGFNLTLSAVCGGYSREPRGKITSPGYPGNYDHALCDWSVIVKPGRTIHAYFEFFDVYSDGTGCVTDELIIRNGGSSDSPFLGPGRYCGNTLPVLPETSGNQLHLSFRGWASNRRGFSLIYEEVSAGCGGEIFLPDGAPPVTISSPNFPRIPPPFTECEWLVSVPQGEAVQITFQVSFDFAESRRCQRAGIEIRDGGTEMSPLIGTFCQSMPGTQTSTGNVMRIRYYTDVSEPRNGFKAEVKIATCGGTLTGWTGQIQTPGFPTSYEPGLNCTWTIKSPPGMSVYLRIREIELGSRRIPVSANSTETICPPDKDRIFVTEPTTPDGTIPRNWTICGYLPFAIISSSNELIVHFISDSIREVKKGAKLAFVARSEPCGGTYSFAPTGIIQTPNYPNPYPHYKRCSWRITGPEESRVRLEFLDFDLEETYTANGKKFCYDSVSIYQGIWRDLPRLYNKTLCGAELPAPVETTQNVMSIYFGSDNSVAHRGFKAQYSTNLPRACGGSIPRYNGTLVSGNITTDTPNTTTSAMCNWRTEVSFNEPEFGSSNSNSTELAPSEGTTILTLNSLSIPPWAAGNDPTCPTGFLRISPGSGGSYTYWKKYCGVLSNVKVYVPGTVLKIEYEASFPQSSFSLDYKTSYCGGQLRGPLDNITSLGFPRNYPASTECIWVLEYEPASQIRVHFLDLDLDGQGSCDTDYLIVRNGKYQTSPVLGKFCGSAVPPDIISMSSHLWIEFHSDSTFNSGRRGFSLQTEQISKGCGGILHRKYGKISSPSVDRRARTRGKYPPNTECEWIIETVPGYVLNFQFDGRFEIEQSANCTNDFVEIFSKPENPAADWITHGRFCGRQLPPQINTTSVSAKVRFVTNGNIDGDGFDLLWYSPCGGLFKEPQGIIRSAHYDRFNHSLSINMENYWTFVGWEANWNTKQCNYVIQGEPQDYIVVEFLPPFDVSVPPSFYGTSDRELASDCPEVNVTILEGTQTPARHGSGPFCGSWDNVPPAFVSQGAAIVSYNYRPSFQNEGFRVKYSIFKCGGVVTSPSLISSPGHPFTSAPHMNCNWTVRAPANKVVRFKLEYLELEFHSACTFDFVKIFDGDSTTNEDKLLGTFCGNMTEDFLPLLSKSSVMTVQFSTDWSIQLGGFRGAVDFTLGAGQGCGGQQNISQSAGATLQIQSPSSGGSQYDANLDCQWIISGPEYQGLQVTFESFNIEGATSGKNLSVDNCPFDYLELRDGPGPYSQLLGKFCGNSNPTPISSSENFIWIRFVSDSSYSFSGFRARIQARESPCGRTSVLNATVETQTLTSPGYPANYGPNIRCKWTISGAQFHDEVDIKFIDMDIRPNSGCSDDRLEIKDVSTSYTTPEGISGPILFIGNGPTDWRLRGLNVQDEIFQDVRYCGSQTPPDFFSVGRSAELVFHSGSSGSAGRGFKIEYKAAGCNRTFESHQGRIFSPEYPARTPLFTFCQFSIRVRNGSTISLYFNKFVLPGPSAGSTECSNGAFEVRDATPTGRLLGKYCSSALPNPVFSSSNVLWISFYTRFQMTDGYDLTYTSSAMGRGCGGEIFHTGGSFTSPLYPGNYSQDSDCRWRVRVPAGLVVQLKVTDFQIGGTSCETDFLEILTADSHTPDVTPSLFSRFCSGDTISTYTGSTDVVVVRYKTSRNNTGTGWRAEFKGVTPTRLPPQAG